jgi:hypothetical protein
MTPPPQKNKKILFYCNLPILYINKRKYITEYYSLLAKLCNILTIFEDFSKNPKSLVAGGFPT